MSIPTVTVTATITDQSGAPIVGALVTVTLSTTEKYGDEYIAPEKTTYTADSGGQVSMALFPNALGEANSYYKLKVVLPDTNKTILSTTMVVPNANCDIADIAGSISATPENTGIGAPSNLSLLDLTSTYLSFLRSAARAGRIWTFPDEAGNVSIQNSGVWTPRFQGSTTPGVNTYSTQDGWWIKRQGSVSVFGRIGLSAKGTGPNAMSGNAMIAGLPFTSHPVYFAALNIANMRRITYASGSSPKIIMGLNDTTASLIVTVSASSNGVIAVSDIGDTADLTFSGEYPIA